MRTMALLLTMCALAGNASSSEAVITLDDLMLDEAILGEPLTLEDLRGRVVLLEFWGIT